MSHPGAAASGTHTYKENDTGLKVTFDQKTPGAPGFKGKDHYHIHNPNANDNLDRYLDKEGNPVAKGSKKSHILPKGAKLLIHSIHNSIAFYQEQVKSGYTI